METWRWNNEGNELRALLMAANGDERDALKPLTQQKYEKCNVVYIVTKQIVPLHWQEKQKLPQITTMVDPY